MDTPPDIEVAFEGKATEGHELDADLVAATIVGVQKAVRMIASASTEGWSGDRSKYRPSKAVRESVVVKVAAPKAGSLVLPMRVLGPGQSQPELIDSFGSFFDWLAGDDERRPDLGGNVLDLMLRSAMDWLPSTSDVAIKLRLRGVDHLTVTSAARERAEVLLALGAIESRHLIGEVTRAYLEEGQVRLRHPPSRRTFRVDVPKDVRAKLSLDKGQWVEVVGRFRCDLRGDPVEVMSVDSLDLPDLSHWTLDEVALDGFTLRASPPRSLTVELDEDTHQLFVVQDASIGLRAFAYDRSDLAEEVREQLRFLWFNYARAESDRLAPDGQVLAAGLRAAFTEQRP
jgi:hypothetical protein